MNDFWEEMTENHIQVCLLTWPLLSDIDVVGEEDKAPVVNPADNCIQLCVPEPLRPPREQMEDQP